jgi:YVTN family beta-propeller protein
VDLPPILPNLVTYEGGHRIGWRIPSSNAGPPMRTPRSLGTVLAVSICLAAAAACGGATPPAAAPVAAKAPATCARAIDASKAPKPVALTRAGSSVALALTPDGKTLAYVADEDDQAVHVIDVDAQKDLASTPVGGRPAQLMFLPDGRLAVAVRDKGQVVVLEPGADSTKAPDTRCAVPTDAEPWGLALSPDDGQLVVTSAWGRSLASYDAKSATMTKNWGVALPREPRSVVVSDDGKKAFVTHAIGGDVSVVDMTVHQVLPTATHPSPENVKAAIKAGTLGKPSSTFEFTTFGDNAEGSSCQGFTLAKTEDPRGRILVPQALVDPGDPTASPEGYGNPGEDQTEVGDVAVLDQTSGALLMASLEVNQSRLLREMQQDAEHDH